ncbi:MAG: Na+/H+ antiporter NhaA [Sphingobium sp.]
MTSPAPFLPRALLHSPAGGGVLLIAAGAAAILLVNAVPGGAHLYHHLLHEATGPELTPRLGPMTVHLWINDGLMTLFFLLVGLEIKREWVDGSLARWDQRCLPIIAAGAGMAVPALVYLAVTDGHPGLAAGWAIPAATDIAFALGVLALLGRRVPASLTILLTTIAIVDDMGAIAIIALAYSKGLYLPALAGAALVLAAMSGLNRAGVTRLLPYLAGFAALWYLLLLSGVHATLAGVLTALTVPVRARRGRPDPGGSALGRLERALHPWIAFLVVPVFGFANAGVVLPASLGEALLSPLPLGIAAGLFVGKQAGILAAVRLSVACGLAAIPRGATWLQVHGLALICGIGFTMSLFIGGLAFPGNAALMEEARIGVLAGSLLSALAGLLLLRFAPARGEAA